MKKVILASVILVIISIFGVVSCKKSSIAPSNPATADSAVAGSITLPAGCSIDVNSLSVLTLDDEQKITNGKYRIAASDSFSTIMVINPANEVILLGYKYPGQNNFEINAKSSALALIMNTPAAATLTQSGKAKLINNILNDNNLLNLTAKIESSIKNGKTLFDTANTDIINGINLMFNSVSSKKIAKKTTYPVWYQRNGKMLSFQNNVIETNVGVPFSSIIGIYKDGVRMKKITIPGIQFYPNTLSGIIGLVSDWTKGITDNPKVDTFELTEDGKYEIKIRTGRPGGGNTTDNSIENNEAFYENIKMGVMQVLSTFIPFIDSKSVSCETILTARVANVISNSGLTSKDASASNAFSIIEQMTVGTLKSSEEFVDCYKPSNNDAPIKFIKGISNLLKFFDCVGKAGNLVNTSILIYQWGELECRQDLCYQIKGGVVFNCGQDSTPILTTSVISSITTVAAKAGGTITNAGSSPVTARGVCWSTVPSPTIAGSHTSDGAGTGTFTSNITMLNDNTTYYVRAYATNIFGTSYGNEQKFTTSAIKLKIGDFYGGGTVGWLLLPGQPGYDASVQHGLIVGAWDLGVAQWGCSGVEIGSTSSAYGSGQTNTTTIVSLCGAGTAADICDKLVLGGYSDWYLPSDMELQLVLQSFPYKPWLEEFWSSSEAGSKYAGKRKESGAEGELKSAYLTVCAIRSF